jgi:hypothetical protein
LLARPPRSRHPPPPSCILERRPNVRYRHYSFPRCDVQSDLPRACLPWRVRHLPLCKPTRESRVSDHRSAWHFLGQYIRMVALCVASTDTWPAQTFSVSQRQTHGLQHFCLYRSDRHNNKSKYQKTLVFGVLEIAKAAFCAEQSARSDFVSSSSQNV